jgi:hypothetical protein
VITTPKLPSPTIPTWGLPGKLAGGVLFETWLRCE